MRRSTGQIVRLIGLAIEVAGILAQVLWSRTDQTGSPLPGQFSSRQVWIVVGFGFVIWMIGTILTYWSQAAPGRRSSTEDVGELKL
ncbi:MAG TPA: hypothetical protein VN648_01110 [Candidatus Methylomirabilis sp.]|nr:hypothetical protein [Candidatus Methylomirabilis sp.]